MIRRPPRSTLDRSSAASDVYKRQEYLECNNKAVGTGRFFTQSDLINNSKIAVIGMDAVSYTHLRAHETVLDIVCRLLLEKKKNNKNATHKYYHKKYQQNMSTHKLV